MSRIRAPDVTKPSTRCCTFGQRQPNPLTFLTLSPETCRSGREGLVPQTRTIGQYLPLAKFAMSPILAVQTAALDRGFSLVNLVRTLQPYLRPLFRAQLIRLPTSVYFGRLPRSYLFVPVFLC